IRNAAAPDAQAPALPMPIGVGKWTWVNFWAAWCGPCKEEMPRLLAMKKKLEAAGANVDLAFVSLDGDERQLHRFLESQAKDGVRASYWFPDGEPRGNFLKGLTGKDMLDLPVQTFFAPSGQVACLAQGAVEESDYPAIASLVGTKR